ncbi:MAG TPA: MBOAT family O-acyltransferase [Draconibacterium sp.]|nr:MBOAT family O-acyltransferase [Draconibacterium sp.]
MLFNSVEFVLFFPLVLLLYWGLFNRFSISSRNIFLLLSSYFFYAWWDYRFLGLILISSVTDYFCGLSIAKSKSSSAKKRYLAFSILVNLSILFTFKYFGFFAEELSTLIRSPGLSFNLSSLRVILPVGISFYTFQTLSYTIDIYRNKIQPTQNALAFFTFVAFFPQLVAGPIERAKHLLPQFNERKTFDYDKAANGFRLILWGFFAKIAVADSVAPIVDQIFINHHSLGALSLVTGAVLFSVQIFGDFAGYSNIAIGTAALLGFDLIKNFNNPYFACNLKEFWSRWHISLSTWFRDYVYIPLGGNRCSVFRYKINILITFTVSGLWHGANWTFIIWGLIHGILYLAGRPFSHLTYNNRRWAKVSAALVTFLLVSFTFVFFRATSLKEAASILSAIVSCKSGVDLFRFIQPQTLAIAVFCSGILFITEWLNRNRKHGLDIAHLKPYARYGIYYAIIAFVLFTFQSNRIFIYFQF